MRASMILLALTIIAWEKTWSWSSDGKSSRRQVGGFIVKNISQTPYVVSIQVKRNPTKDVWNPICAGTLLSALYVITACHCVAKTNSAGAVVSLTAKDLPLKSWLFLAGAVDVTYPTWRNNPAAQIRTPQSIRHHPRCMLCQNPFLYSDVSVNDVALAKMEKPFDLNTYVKTAELFSFYEGGFSVRLLQCYGREAEKVISGWGSTEFKGVEDDFRLPGNSRDEPGTNEDPLTKNKLKKINVRILQDEEHCRDRMYKSLLKKDIRTEINDTQWEAFSRKLNSSLRGQICSWSKSEGPCQGDAGAGFICIERSRSFIVGVNSWSIGCGDGIPSVAQSFGSKDVLHWIEEESCSCKTCEDYQYLVDGCDPPVDDSFDACKFSSTTSRTATKTTATTSTTKASPSIVDRTPINHEHDSGGYSSACAISTDQVTMILAFLCYMMKLT